MPRILLIAASFMLIAGCNSAEAGCEDAIKKTLRSPSTFKMISSTSTRQTAGNGTYDTVNIEYDAENAFGAPIRSTARCDVPVRDGMAIPGEAIIMHQS